MRRRERRHFHALVGVHCLPLETQHRVLEFIRLSPLYAAATSEPAQRKRSAATEAAQGEGSEDDEDSEEEDVLGGESSSSCSVLGPASSVFVRLNMERMIKGFFPLPDKCEHTKQTVSQPAVMLPMSVLMPQQQCARLFLPPA